MNAAAALAIAAGFSLPAKEAATQTYAFIARKGGGKTYATGVLVEELMRLGVPVIVLDPIGTWYGLRLAADGKRPGLSIPVFGGEHGDVPIDVAQGDHLARVLVRRNSAAVVDVSGFRKGEMKRFVAEFAEGLYHEARTHRTPRMVVFEEAQTFAPQRTSHGEERMLGAVEDIVRKGRNFGLGTVLISQRPQSVNKEVLNQVEALFVGQLSGPQERKTIEAWCTMRDGDVKALKELPHLQRGSMVLWSPQWLGIMQKVKIKKKWTYDASSTPELGDKFEVRPLAPVDVDELRKLLEPVPKTIGKKGAANTQAPAADSLATKEIKRSLEIRNGELLAELTTAREERDVSRYALRQLYALLRTASPSLQGLLDFAAGLARMDLGKLTRDDVLAASGRPRADLVHVPAGDGKAEKLAARLERNARAEEMNAHYKTQAAQSVSKSELRGGKLRMLQVLASFYPHGLSRKHVAKGAKMAASSGTFGTYWSALSTAGLIEEHAGKWRATQAGVKAVGGSAPKVAATKEARVAFWRERLKGKVLVMFDSVTNYGAHTRDELAAAAGLVATSGTFGTYLSSLVSNELLLKQGDHYVLHPSLTGSG